MTADARFGAVKRFEVSFRHWFSLLPNDFDLRGDGYIEIDDRGVAMSGADRRGSKPHTLHFHNDEIFDVTREGRTVWFRTPPSAPQKSARPRRLVLHARNAAEARSIAAALPATESPQRRHADAEQNEFVDRLYANTPRLWVTPLLVGINIAVFVAMLAAGAGLFDTDPAVHLRWGSNFGPLTSTGQPWRLLTNTFLHFGLLHIALNMWALFDAGRVAERMYGNLPFLALYLIAGIGGSAASLWWNPQVNSAGASGAVFGVFGALLVYLVDRRIGVPLTVNKAYRASLVVFIGYSLFFGVVHKGIDNAAHIGGLAAGMLAGWVFARPLDRSRRTRARLRLVAGAGVLAIALALTINTAIVKARVVQHERTFELVLTSFTSQEKLLNSSMQTILASLRSGQYSVPRVLAGLLTQAGVWEAIREQLASVPLEERSAYHPLHERLIRYAELRRDLARLLTESVRTGSDEPARAAANLLKEEEKLEAEIAKLPRPR